MRAVQELAGHQDLTMTERYAHLSPAALIDTVRLLGVRDDFRNWLIRACFLTITRRRRMGRVVAWALGPRIREATERIRRAGRGRRFLRGHPMRGLRPSSGGDIGGQRCRAFDVF